MNTILTLTTIIGIEIILNLIFSFITPKSMKKSTIDYSSIFKGILERIFLVTSLLSGYPHALTVFSALKLGTRLKTEEQDKKFNDFYLTGNFISVLAALFYVFLIQKAL